MLLCAYQRIARDGLPIWLPKNGIEVRHRNPQSFSELASNGGFASPTRTDDDDALHGRHGVFPCARGMWQDAVCNCMG